MCEKNPYKSNFLRNNQSYAFPIGSSPASVTIEYNILFLFQYLVLKYSSNKTSNDISNSSLNRMLDFFY